MTNNPKSQKILSPQINVEKWDRVAKTFPLGKISTDLDAFQKSLDASGAITKVYPIIGKDGLQKVRELAESFIETEKLCKEFARMGGVLTEPRGPHSIQEMRFFLAGKGVN